MRRLGTNNDVITAYINWVQGHGSTICEAATPSGNLFFIGTELYSYGLHHVLASAVQTRRVIRNTSLLIYLVNEDKASTTTHQHRRLFTEQLARLGGLQDNLFFVGCPTARTLDQHNYNLEGYKDRLHYALRRFSVARSRRDEWHQLASEISEEALDYARVFTGQERVDLTPAFALTQCHVKQEK